MKEHDIRPADLFDEYLRLSAADIVHYFPDGEDRVERPCPGCAGTEHTPAFEKNSFQLVRCSQCETLFVNPAPSNDRLSSFYGDSPSQHYWSNVFFPAVAEARRDKIFRPRAEQIGALLKDLNAPAGRIIDVGAGTGLMLEELQAAGIGKSLAAVEPSTDLAGNCRAKGYDTYEGLAEGAAGDPQWANSASLVTSFEVIEHVASAEGFVRDLASLAKPGGLVLFTGICGTGFDLMVLGVKSKAISPPHHLNFISPRGISSLLARCGLEEVKFLTPGRIDVDIVRNALADDPETVTDPFLRHLLVEGSTETRDAFQKFLSDRQLSSHMWSLARKPA